MEGAAVLMPVSANVARVCLNLFAISERSPLHEAMPIAPDNDFRNLPENSHFALAFQ